MISKPLSSLLLLTGALFFFASCSQKKAEKKETDNWDVKNTRIVDSYDQVNKIAIRKAQDSLFLLLNLFNNKRDSLLEFFVKSKFSDGENIENMWSTLIAIHDDSVYANLDNTPLKITNIKLNDRVAIAKKDIKDWTIYKGDSVVYGDFMVRNSR